MPETYRSPHAGTIADLIRQRGTSAAQHARTLGDVQAQRIAASGQAWGNAIGNIAQGMSGTLRDFAQQRENAPRNQLIQRQSDQLAAELTAMETTAAQKKIGELAQMVKASNYDPSTAEPVFRAIAKLSPEYEQPLLRSLMEPALLKNVTDTLISQTPGYKAPGMMQRDPTKDLVNESTGEVVQPGVAAPTQPPTSIDAAILAADRAGNAAEVERLLGLKRQSSEAGRAPTVETPVNTQRVEVLLDGKPGFAVFNPRTEKFTVNGVDVTSRVRPIPPQGPAGGEPLESVIDPKTGEAVLLPRSQARGMRPATTREQPTEDERKSAGFYKRMQEAIAIMDATEDQLTETELYQIQTLPQEELVGAINRGQMSEAAKRYLRAFEQFTEARMRPVSGAAISDSEFARDRRTYARQYSETPQLRTDRRNARTSALESLKTRAMRALPKDGGKVTLIAPDGTEKDVDPSEVAHYTALGARVKPR